VDLWVWGAFVGFILVMLVVDLFVVHRDAHAVGFREAATWTAIWVGLALAFGAIIWIWKGPQAGGLYLAGYLIEYSLSVDNIFIFVLIFGYFAVPARYQPRVLLWGVLGAIVFRATFIAAGITLLERFAWMIYVFGAFLVITGIRMVLAGEERVDPGRNPVLRAFRRVVPVTDAYEDHRMLVRRTGRWMATPLLAVLVVVETTDLIFAVDSIPAILAVTDEPFLVFTSNAFAILGLRSMYFLLAGMMDRFRYLKLGLAAVLVFVGAKMLASDLVEVPIWASLAAISATIGVAVAASLRRPVEDFRPVDRGE